MGAWEWRITLSFVFLHITGGETVTYKYINGFFSGMELLFVEHGHILE